MPDLISLDKHLRIWAPEPPVSNLPAKLGSSPSLAYSIGSPRRQSMTQALSPTSLPIQGGSLTNQVSDDAFVISPENQGKDSHGCGTYTDNKDMANTSLLHSDIGKLCSNNKYSLFKPEIIMSIGDKKSNETAVGIFSGGADAEFSDGEEAMSLCTDLSYQQQDGSAITQASCDELHCCTTPYSVPTIANRSSSLSLDSDSNNQPAPLARRSTPKPSSNYSNLSQYGLDTVGEQPKNGRTNLDSQPSPLETGQVLKNGVSSHICISGEDSQKLLPNQTRNRYELRGRSIKKTSKRPITEGEIDNDENESLPSPKRAKGRRRPRERKSRATGEPKINRSNTTSTGMEGLASAAVNNEKECLLSNGYLHWTKDNGKETVALYFTLTSPRDEDSTISEILRGVTSTNKGGPQTNMLLLSHAVLKSTKINGAPGLTFSSQVEGGGKRCRAHASQDLTPVEAPLECYQEDTDQVLTPIEMLLAKVFDFKHKKFKYLAKWKGWHDKTNEWRWESELRQEDVERYNRDHPQNFYGKVVDKCEENGVIKYRMKWNFIPKNYSWLRKNEIVEELITEYEEKEGKK